MCVEQKHAVASIKVAPHVFGYASSVFIVVLNDRKGYPFFVSDLQQQAYQGLVVQRVAVTKKDLVV
jgi:hypothetical protein